MSETLRWWFLLVVIGTLMLPLCLAVFRRLPDRGYALSKPFGLLLLGYVFWLLNSFHLLPNDARGVIGAALPLIALSAWFAYREWDTLVAWVREHWHYIAGVEALFFIAFITAVWLRSTVGEIVGTEQPMDLMFLNAARQADNFPPEDPWLSGETVAYYWFGYLLVAMMSHITSVSGDVAYNIGLGMIAAMAFVAASGIVYGLVFMREQAVDGDSPQTREPRVKENKSRRRRQAAEADAPEPASASQSFAVDWSAVNWRPYVFGFAGGLILIVMGNLVFALVFASSYNIGGDGFYDWVDVSGLVWKEPRETWYPSEFFQFFGATRILPLDDADFRAITEFPMFSFLLGDLHPHVMALPFVLLVVGLALSLYRSEEPLDITFWLERPLLLLAAGVLLGGLTFINTWDIATFSFVVIAAVFVSNFMRVRALTGDLFVQVGSFAAPLVVLAFLFYVPFLTSIAGNSQADSFNAVVTNDRITVAGTRPLHLLLFWGSLFVLVLPFIGARLWASRERITRKHVAWAFAPAAAVLVGWVLLYIVMLAIDASNLGTGNGNIFEQLIDRGTAWLSAIFIAACLAGALLALWAELTAPDRDDERRAPIFVLTLLSVGLLLILGCEFFYVGDVFKSRMNTVFKLYYQAWLLLAVSGGFSLYYLASSWRFTFPQAVTYRRVWAGTAIVILALAALYPIGGTMNRARPYNNEGGLIVVGGSLHGLANKDPDELAAFAWLNERAKGQDLVIAEAVGDDYNENGRVSMATGLPAVLGWLGHENQWRDGTCPPCAGRFEDMEALYRNTDPAGMQEILQKYDVAFVYVGPLERSRYGEAGMAKFQDLPVAFQQGAVTIYRAP